jgi:hypothetical protein
MSQINKYPNLNQPIESLVGNDGIVVPPIFDGVRWDVFVIGAGHVFTTGNIALGTLTINIDGGIADLYPTDNGVANPIGGVLNIFGGSNINTEAPAIPGNSVIVNLDNNVHITGTFIADGDITSTAGDISATLGFLNAGTTVTAGTGITSTTGNITASAGNVVITAGNLNLPDTNNTGTQGEITFGGNRWVSNFGADNTFVGEDSGNTAVTGAGNSGFGSHSANALTSGADNTLIGDGSGLTINTGAGNTAIGSNSLSSLIDGGGNTCLGQSAGSALTGTEDNNLCLDNDGVTGVSDKIYIGDNTVHDACFIAGEVTGLRGITATTFLTATLGNITATAGNVVITAGNLTLPNTNAAGTEGEITFGGNRWISNFGFGNTFVGLDAGNTITAGAGINVGVGSGALLAITTGTQDVGLGAGALQVLNTGNFNLAIGTASLSLLLTGSNNTAIGNAAGSVYNGAESSNVIIGHVGVLADNNTIRLGTNGAGPGQQDRCFVAGIRGVAPAVTDSGVMLIDSDHQLGSLGAMTDGQLVIGSTGLNPVLGDITPGVGVSVVDGPGTITIGVEGGGIDWTVEAVDLAGVVNHGYLANKVGRLDVSLPAVSIVGDIIRIVNVGATAVGWRITQGANQRIWMGNSPSTIGAGGYIEATDIGDAVELVCYSDDLFWIATSAPQGNITVV